MSSQLKKNITETKPLDVEMESNASVPGPGVIENIKIVKARIIKIFNSIINALLIT
jgi:hypothetical protein